MGGLIFYKISKEDANLIGKFEYKKGEKFDPFCNEQVDGYYLVSIHEVEKLKDHQNIKKIDWTKLTKISLNEVNTKIVSLTNT